MLLYTWEDCGAMPRSRAPGRNAQLLGARIRAARTERGESIERLAEAAHMHWSYVASIERGERNVTVDTLVRVAAGLGVDPGALVEGLQPE